MKSPIWYFALSTIAAFCSLIPATAADACWCRRVYTGRTVDPCVPCVASTAPSCATRNCGYSCPTGGCSEPCVSRCYVEPQVGYQVVSRLEPQIAYVRRSYYDSSSCCDRSYFVPTTQYVQRCYQIPVTTYSLRCCTDPQDACPASYESPAAKNSTQSDGEEPRSRSGEGKELQRPIFRESAPAPEPLPRPIPMPEPQSSLGRPAASTTWRESVAARAFASR